MDKTGSLGSKYVEDVSLSQKTPTSTALSPTFYKNLSKVLVTLKRDRYDMDLLPKQILLDHRNYNL